MRTLLVVNAIAWAAFAVLFGLVGLVAGDWSGLAGFFLIFASAFAAASVFDRLYDRWILGLGQQTPAAPEPQAPAACERAGKPEKRRKSRR